MRLLRNLVRRKVWTTLTIVGVTVGIWALVVMGSMANKIGALVEGGSTYYEDKIIVSDATNPAFGFGFTPMPLGTVDEIRAVPNVAVVVPEVQMLFDPDDSGAGFGLPDFIVGSVAGADEGRETFELKAAQGRLLSAEDEGSDVVVLGADMARKFDKQAGDTIDIRDREFSIVGVLEPTLTAPDTTAVLPLEAAQRLLAENSSAGSQAGLRSRPAGLPVRSLPGGRDRYCSFGLCHRAADRSGADHHRRGVQRTDRIGGCPFQRHHPRRRVDQPGRRRPIRDQHDGHERRRTNARDRHQTGDRRVEDTNHARDRVGSRYHGTHRRARRPDIGPLWS